MAGEQSVPLLSRTTAGWFLRGVAMGLGDAVPGVSGGTIAVITNIYDRLIYGIRSVDAEAVRLLVAGRVADAWRHIDGNFLAVIALGILAGLLVSANTVLYLLENQFVLLMAFFMGLVLASVGLLARQYRLSDWRCVLLLVTGIGFTTLVSQLSPQVVDPALPYLFLCGMVAISAMILPGLSGAFILILLGAYEFVLSALINFDVPVILVFVCGCATGILAASRVLAWLLKNFHSQSYAFISGMLLGSLAVLWPWQQATMTLVDSDGESHVIITENLMPAAYLEQTGFQPMVPGVLLFMLIGVGLVLGLAYLSSRGLAKPEGVGQ